MLNGTIKVSGAKALLNTEGNPVPKKFTDLHYLLKEIEGKKITLTNPDALTGYFRNKYNSFPHIQQP